MIGCVNGKFIVLLKFNMFFQQFLSIDEVLKIKKYNVPVPFYLPPEQNDNDL